MGEFYIMKVTAKEYPNIFRELNKKRKRKISIAYDISYSGKSISSYKPLGYTETLEEAKNKCMSYSINHFKKLPDINVKDNSGEYKINTQNKIPSRKIRITPKPPKIR